MIIGAACGFAFAYLTGSTLVGVVCGILAGVAVSAVFAFLTLGLAANQVAAGLALTIFGVGLSGLIGEGFVGRTGPAGAPSLYSRPHRSAAGRQACCSARTSSSISRSRWSSRSGCCCIAPAPAWSLRAVGENHTSAHSLGVPVRGIRLLAVLFGGACAGLAGSYLSLSYTPFLFAGHDGGARLDRAGAGGVRLVEAVAGGGRRLLFGGVAVLALAARDWAADPAAIAHLAALSGDDRRARIDFGCATAGSRCAGFARHGVHSRPLSVKYLLSAIWIQARDARRAKSIALGDPGA